MPEMTIGFDGEFITLRGYYHIPVDYLNTQEKLDVFIKHLYSKRWMCEWVENEIRKIAKNILRMKNELRKVQ